MDIAQVRSDPGSPQRHPGYFHIELQDQMAAIRGVGGAAEGEIDASDGSESMIAAEILWAGSP